MKSLSPTFYAGFCLAFFLLSCGKPLYRLDGRAPREIGRVSLLDSTAVLQVDSLRARFEREMSGLERNTRTALDSLSAGSSSLEAPLSQASSRLAAARKRYQQAFEGLDKYTSFGGNPIFSKEDLGVRTSRLLQEIADRFYKGKAFSLETESEVRRYIRDRLVPLERAVTRARNRVAGLQKSRKGSVQAREQVERDFRKRSEVLREQANNEIQEALRSLEVTRTEPDSTGVFLFPNLIAAKYHLFGTDSLSSIWLVPVKMNSHRRQDLGESNLRLVLFAAHPDPEK